MASSIEEREQQVHTLISRSDVGPTRSEDLVVVVQGSFADLFEDSPLDRLHGRPTLRQGDGDDPNGIQPQRPIPLGQACVFGIGHHGMHVRVKKNRTAVEESLGLERLLLTPTQGAEGGRPFRIGLQVERDRYHSW